MTRPQHLTGSDHPQRSAEAAAIEDAPDELRREIIRRVAPVLSAAGIATNRVVCLLEPATTRLDVSFHLPVAVSPATKQALAVRVLDAVRGGGRTFGPVHVSVYDQT